MQQLQRTIASLALVVGTLIPLAGQAATAVSGDIQVQSYRTVSTYQDGTKEFTIAPTEQGVFQLLRQDHVGLYPLPNWIGYEELQEYIVFSGNSAPEAHVILRLAARKPVAVSTHADAAGAWEITLPVATLPAGSYQAFVRTEVGEEVSDEAVVADFAVQVTEQISNTTWMVIMIGGIGIVILLVVVNLQFLFQRRINDLYSVPPGATTKE